MTDVILLQTKIGVWDIIGSRAPTGLLNIAAVPYKMGYKVTLIDQRINPEWQADVRHHLSQGARIVGLTVMVGEQIRFMMETSRFIKSVAPGTLVFLGGSWAQTEPEMCLQDENIDVICYGEGDCLIPELIDCVSGKKSFADVKGIVFRKKDGKISRNEPRPLVRDLDELPPIPYSLVNLKDYTAIKLREGHPSISFVTSRGCNFRCSFCSIVCMFGQTWRGYSVERTMKDMETLDMEFGIRDFYFNDDNIAGDIRRFTKLIKTLAEAGKDYCWGTAGIRADSILRLTEQDLDNLYKSGCRNLDIGVESANPRVLELIKKDLKLEVVEEVNRRLSKYPIIIKYTFMGGFPTETEQEFRETLRFRKKLMAENRHATAPMFMYTPFPKTELFSLAVANGLRMPKTLLGWADFNYNTWYRKYPSWLSKRMIALVENAVFLSYFADKNMAYKYANPLLSLLYRLYYPLAKYRYEHDYYGFMFEKKAAVILGNLNNKFDFFNKFKGK